MKHKWRLLDRRSIHLKKKKSSIKWKVFIYLIGFTAFLLALVWYFQIAHLNSFYKTIKKSELKDAAKELLTNIDSEDLGQYILNIADDYDISINLTDDKGKSIYNANITETSHIYIFSDAQFENIYERTVNNGGTIMYEVSGRYRELMEGDSSFRPGSESNVPPDISTYNPDETKETDESVEELLPDNSELDKHMNKGQFSEAKSVVYAKIIECTDGSEYVLLMSSLITPVDATVYTLRIQFIYISIIFVAMAVAVALIISRIVAKPIVKINDAAKHLAEGNFDIRFEERGYKEVSELSGTLNYAANELGRTERLQKDLIANVSHDLRTPLTMITAYSEVMRDLPGENNPENVQVIIDEAKRLTTLVNDMLDLSKLQAGVTELNADEFDFTTNILAVMNRFSKLTQQDGYSIQFEYNENVRIIADEYKIYQVVYNLINNAINYAGEDKTVIVRQIVHGSIVRLEIEDHGKGIDAEELKNIWDRYYKIDKTHKRAVQGSGLGLSIVQNILQLHNAKYGVISDVGKGSIFWFEMKTIENEEQSEQDDM